MLTVYVITAIVGGVLVLLSAVGGFDKEADFDTDLDVDADVDIEVDFDADVDADVAGGDGDADVAADELWLPFLSMRFWTYFAAFFGVTGLLLTWIGQAELTAALLSAGMGLACGLGMAYGTRYFRRATPNSGAGVRDFVGAEGRVLIRLRPGSPGKIRCRVRGREIDLLATSDESGELERGARVLIIGFEEHVARVVRVSYGELAEEAGGESEAEADGEPTEALDAEAERRVKS